MFPVRKRHPHGRPNRADILLSDRENEIVRTAAEFAKQSFGAWVRQCAVVHSYKSLKENGKFRPMPARKVRPKKPKTSDRPPPP